MFDTRKYLVTSVALSLLFHFLLFAVAKKLPAYDNVKAREAKLRERKPIKLRTFKFKPRKTVKQKPSKFNLSIKESATRLAEAFSKNSSLDLKKPVLNDNPGTKKKKLDDILGNAPQLKTDTPSRELPPGIYHLNVANADLKLHSKSGTGIESRLPEMKLKSPSKGNPLASGLQGGSTLTDPQVSFRRSIPSITPPDLKFRGGKMRTPGRSIGSPGLGINQGGGDDKDQPKELESFLSIRPYVYIDEQDETGYFRLDLSFNRKAGGLEPLPKDVIFVVDTSKSISIRQLREFKVGVISGLQTLGDNDRFEIVDFTTSPKPLFNGFKKTSSKTLQKGEEFVRGFSSGGQTDVYSALRPFVESGEGKRPTLLYVLTDGVSTVSESMANSPLISEVTKKNKKVSVFGFSCGDDINSFLLDFLTYRNRGDSEIINGTEGASKKLHSYIAERSKVIVSDLSYRYMGRNFKDVFPKSLPHMYRKRTLSIFGTFNLDEKDTMIQLSGNSSSGKRQLIYRLRYEEAERSSRELAKSWAAQKIFHLIGELTDNPTPETVQQIRQLQQKFEVYIPYNLPGTE